MILMQYIVRFINLAPYCHKYVNNTHIYVNLSQKTIKIGLIFLYLRPEI